MKLTNKRLTSFLLAVIMVLSLLPAGALEAFAAGTSDYYVALGDSASGGYGADGRFVGNYATKLAELKDYKLTEESLFVGSTAWILDRLEWNTETRQTVEQAGLITIMLGVDEMMNVVYQAMADKYNATQDEHISASSVPDIINGKGSYDKNVKMQLMLNAMPLLNKEGQDYLVKSKIFTDAVKAFSENLTAIVDEIRSLAPDATLLVATQYNPFTEYNGHKITIPLSATVSVPYDLTSLYQCMEDGVTVLNTEIKKNASANGYELVDIKAVFEKKHSAANDLYAAHAGDTLSTLSWDICPTDAGKAEIAAAFAEKTPDAPKFFNVSFDANGGSGQMDSLVVGESYTLPKLGFTAPKGYEFVGWSTAADGQVISGSTITLSEDITLYAIWKAQELTGTAKISGAMQVGSTLTVTVSGTNNTGNFSYQWYRDNTPISGATGATYKLTDADTGHTFYCEATSSVQTGTLKSDVTGKVQAQIFADGEIQIESYTGTYDGNIHTFSVKVPADTSVEFSIDDANYAPEQPEYKTAGTYTVFYRVTKTGFAAVTGTVQVAIERKDVTVKADGFSIIYGDKEPALTYQVEGLIGNEKLEGALARDPGNDVGKYDIHQGTLTNETNPNYNIDFTGNVLTIGKKAPTYTVPSGLTAVYGQRLLEVKLPAGFSWQDPRSYVGDVGSNSHLVIYTPEDAVNYEVEVLSVDLKVIDAPNSVQVDFDSKLGDVTGAGVYEDGAKVSLSAKPKTGSRFLFWVDGSVKLDGSLTEKELRAAIISENPDYDFVADGDRHLQAVFAAEQIEIVPMLITGTDSKSLQAAKRLNTKQDFGGISPDECPIKLSAQNGVKKEITEGEKQYKFAGFIVSGYDANSGARTVELREELTLELQPLYGSAEYKKWIEPISGGIYAAYVENTSVTGTGNSKNPATGDNSDILMWLVILVFCVGGVALLSLTGRKKKK